MRVASLFAGCGGSSCGYQAAGSKVVLAAEWDEGAAGCYSRNFPETPLWVGDVADLSVEKAVEMSGCEPGELDLLDGSPPCQGFSTSGRRDPSDPRSQLFLEYVRLLRGLRPKAFAMENVAAMASGRTKHIYCEAVRELRGCGYRVAGRVLNAWWYGVPQDRERLVVVGVRDDLGRDPPCPVRTHRVGVSVEDALGLPWAMRNPEFNNWWRPPELPAPTLVRSSPPEAVLCLSRGLGRPYVAKGSAVRRVTVEEAKILQGFPESMWVDCYGRIGNSVPPAMAKAVAIAVRKVLEECGAEARTE